MSWNGRNLYWLVTVVLIVSSAAAEGQATRFPVFDGTVVPITKPIKARYGSFEAEESTQVTFEANRERAEMWTKVQRRSQRRGDELHQFLQLHDIAVTGTRMSRKDKKQLASLKFFVRSDTLGVARSFDVEGLEKLGIAPDQMEAAKVGARSMAKTLPLLPAHSVKTGDLFVALPMRETLAGDDQELAWMFPAEPVQLTLAGHGYLDGTKVLVATILTDLPIDVLEEDGGTGSITVGGYALYEAVTLAPLKSDVLMILNITSKSGERATMTVHAQAKSTFTLLPDLASVPALMALPSLVGLSVQSKLDAEGKPQTYAFFDVSWQVTNPRSEPVEGKLVLLDGQGKERIAMPWTIAAADAANASFTETGVGFLLSQFGAHGAWLRVADVQDIRLRFEPR